MLGAVIRHLSEATRSGTAGISSVLSLGCQGQRTAGDTLGAAGRSDRASRMPPRGGGKCRNG